MGKFLFNFIHLNKVPLQEVDKNFKNKRRKGGFR